MSSWSSTNLRWKKLYLKENMHFIEGSEGCIVEYVGLYYEKLGLLWLE